MRTRQNVGESVFSHVGWFNGGHHGAGFCVVGAQCVPLFLESVFVGQVIFHVRLTHAEHNHAAEQHYNYLPV